MDARTLTMYLHSVRSGIDGVVHQLLKEGSTVIFEGVVVLGGEVFSPLVLGYERSRSMATIGQSFSGYVFRNDRMVPVEGLVYSGGMYFFEAMPLNSVDSPYVSRVLHEMNRGLDQDVVSSCFLLYSGLEGQDGYAGSISMSSKFLDALTPRRPLIMTPFAWALRRWE